MKTKASTVIVEVLDERGRYISQKEFRWLMSYFRDRYDPRRLSLALGYTTGLRLEDYSKARVKWFTPDFQMMKMSQCKAHIKKKDGIIHARVKPRFVPLPNWLSLDLFNYTRYRLSVGYYVGIDLSSGLLFPSLKKEHLRCLFQKLRQRYGDKEPWLKDVWQIVKHYDKHGNLVRKQKYYRVACHACRSNYCTAAHEVCNYNPNATKVLSGHNDIRDLDRYIKVTGIQEKKRFIKERYMDCLLTEQKIPLSKEQRSLKDY